MVQHMQYGHPSFNEKPYRGHINHYKSLFMNWLSISWPSHRRVSQIWRTCGKPFSARAVKPPLRSAMEVIKNVELRKILPLARKFAVAGYSLKKKVWCRDAIKILIFDQKLLSSRSATTCKPQPCHRPRAEAAPPMALRQRVPLPWLLLHNVQWPVA